MVLEHVEPREAQMRSDDTDAHPQVRSERHPADAVCYVESYEDAESAGVDASIRGGDDIIKAEVDADYKQLAAEDKPVVVVAGVAVNGWRRDREVVARWARGRDGAPGHHIHHRHARYEDYRAQRRRNHADAPARRAVIRDGVLGVRCARAAEHASGDR